MSADPRLAAAVAGYLRGDAAHQRALLEEFEPLLYGYLRSMLGGAAENTELAARATHDLLVAFHLRLLAGALRLTDAASLRAIAHRMSVVKAAALRAGAAPELAFLADPESWSLAAAWPAAAARLAGLLDAGERSALAARLCGDPGAALQTDLRLRLLREGVLACDPREGDGRGPRGEAGIGNPP